MTVAELIEKLRELPQDAIVSVLCDWVVAEATDVVDMRTDVYIKSCRYGKPDK